jgi:RHH-type transcriptional regulator, proline utilization regulon repressor / proline dehydrogenase / delta 1-pyrroline-5-carboxylate dehydrogenase
MLTHEPNSKNSKKHPALALPEIKTLPFTDIPWNVSYYQEYENVFLDSTGKLDVVIQESLSPYLHESKTYRLQVHLKGTPFLASFFPEENLVRMSTPRLNQELFIIKSMEKFSLSKEINEEESSKYEDFRKYTESIIALDPTTFPSVIDLVSKKEDLPHPFKDNIFEESKTRTGEITNQLLLKLNQYSPSFFEKISDFALGLTAQYALLRIHLLKFLAILPSLDHDKRGLEVKRILLESLRRLLVDTSKAKIMGKKGQNRPLPGSYVLLFRLTYVAAGVFPAGPLAFIVRQSVRFMAKRFIAGETIESATTALKDLASTGRDVTLDQLGELVVSEKEADHYCNEVIKLIRGFSLHVRKGERNASGINRAHVSIKVSALCSDFKPHAFDYTYKLVSPRLIKILKEAKEHDVFINIDAEHYDYRDIVFKVYKKVLLETEELKDFKATGIVLQAYLRDGATHLAEIVELAKERDIVMPIRIVKGAYWDAETVEADAHSFDAPEFLNKEETDIHFRQLTVKIMENWPHVQLCLASHNFSDHAFAEAIRELKFKDLPVIEHQCLHMTYEALSTAMAKMGWVVRNYVPIGSLIVGMAYLVRRIMENSSQVGVLTIMRSHKKQVSMKDPQEVHLEKIKDISRTLDKTQLSMTDAFFNLSPLRLYLDRERVWMEKSLNDFKTSHLGMTYNNCFNPSGVEQKILSSSNPDLEVGKITFSTKQDVERAITTLSESYQSGDWAQCHWARRSIILTKAANLMTALRNDLSALIVLEAGKTVPEALADVDEAIDFLNFYAREEARFKHDNPDSISRGVVGVIAPWNFPLAIPCGMTVAALVAGNTVILKSAEQTPLIAQKLVDILYEAGVPENVLIHLPGTGEEVGQALVDSNKIAQIVFTGSKPVGMMIAHHAGKKMVENKLYNQTFPTKIITEMGGKNAVIVTANAELDETVAGILYSSFGHAGQKCSAASRVLVDNSVKHKLIERLKEAVRDMEVSEAWNFSTTVNPLISLEDRDRIRRQVKEASEEVSHYGGQVIIDRSNENLPGFCVGPTLIELPKSRALDQKSFAVRELFGPVVHIIGFDTLDEALRLYNGTEYALTGGVFSQSQDDIDYLTQRMESGNIYVNRSITGARVAIEPFGGFKLSGTGPKAGGKAYLGTFHVIPFDEYVPGGVKAPVEEEGSDYEFDLARPSGLTPEMRMERITKGLQIFINQFEVLYQGIYVENKDHLKKFKRWLEKHLVTFQEKPHNNRVIPGQISVNDFNIPREHTIVVSYEKRPYFNILLQTFSALAMGSGVTVLCRNTETYEWWGQLRIILSRAGFSRENFDVYMPSQKQLAKALENSLVSTILVDGDSSKVKHILDLVYTGNYNESRMKLVVSPHDSPNPEDFKQMLANFTWVRSFAVNTMRHGAPLDLGL